MRIGPNMRSVAAAAEPALNRVLACLPASNPGRPDPETALANAPRQDADYERLTGVDVCSSRPDRNFTVPPGTRGG